MKIEKGRRVKLKVHLSVVGGDTLEKSVVDYIHGSGTMLAGLEKVLEGLEKGAKRDGVLEAKQAFGSPAAQLRKSIPRAELPEDAKPEVGARFVAHGADGLNVVLVVEKVTDKVIETRMLHPLAEKDIKYEVEVLGVTDPKPPPVPIKADVLEDDE